jgi:SAM-dependent methyltransferase
MSHPEPRAEDWHVQQDRLIDSSLDVAAAISASPDPVFRSFQFCADSLFYNAHLLTLIAEYPQDASFRVIDIGCGDGRTAHDIARLFPNAEVLGLDANARSLQICLERPPLPNLTFVAGRFEEQHDLGVFDVAVCSEVFEHVVEAQGLLSTCAAAVRPGGLLSFSTPSGWIARQPRLSLLKMALRDREAWRLRAFPERNWPAALAHHPGTRLGVLRTMTSAAGFDIEARRSSLATVDRGSRSTLTGVRRLLGRPAGDNSMLFAAARTGRPRTHVQASRVYHLYMLLEAIMNLVPATRVLESRTFLTLRRRS